MTATKPTTDQAAATEPAVRLNFDPDLDVIRPLTKKIAASTGHIAWVEDPDPIIAMTKMFNAIESGRANVAVWADAGVETDRYLLSDLAHNRPLKAIESPARSFDHLHYGTDDSAQSKIEKTSAHLREYFDKTYRMNLGGRVDMSPAIFDLRKHTIDRVSAMLRAMPIRELDFDLRAGKHATTNNQRNVHIDQSMFHTFRLLENFNCPGTCLIANDDAQRFVRRPPPGMPGAREVEQYALPVDKPVTFYQVPVNSLTMISNNTLNRQPIAHVEPPTPPGCGRPIPRTMGVYDIRT